MTLSTIDRLISGFDQALRVTSGHARALRKNPANVLAEAALSEAERRHAAALMRVNHAGEVCAQAMYDAQAQFSAAPAVRDQFERSAHEEEDHLAWTAERLRELNARTSLLAPFWYAGAFACGALAARCGDAASLGFVVETEKQVEAHLASHLNHLPENDGKSRAIVEQMRQDEIAHGAAAQALGAAAMPAPVRLAMRAMAAVMTRTAYYV